MTQGRIEHSASAHTVPPYDRMILAHRKVSAEHTFGLVAPLVQRGKNGVSGTPRRLIERIPLIGSYPLGRHPTSGSMRAILDANLGLLKLREHGMTFELSTNHV